MSDETKSPSLYEKLGVIISALGLLVSLVGLVFVVRSLRAVDRQLENSAFQTINEQILEQDKIFIEHPKLRPYFFDGVALTEADRKDAETVNSVKAIADSRLDFFDLLWTQSEYVEELKVGGPGWQAWECYMRDSFDRSPAMRERLQEVGHWYTKDFVEQMKTLECR